MMQGELAVRAQALALYPVKACAGVSVQALQFTRDGRIAGDREWAVANARGELVWQGSHPRLALVQPQVAEGRLLLNAPGLPGIEVPEPGIACDAWIWNEGRALHERFAAHDAGAQVAAWLEQAAGEPLRLLRLGPDALRRDTLQPLHVVSAASMAALNARLAARGQYAVAVERLRPNIVIAHDALQPFDEDHFESLAWPALQLEVVAPCVRCIVPNVDLVTAQLGDEPLRTITELSAERHPGGPVRFGVYARVLQGGQLRVGEAGSGRWRF